MAQRRMFSIQLLDSDDFLSMPMSTQALYMHLALRADDDGFVGNPKRIVRMVSAAEDELKLLLAKRYLIPFESGVCVIRHWRIHNYIQSDRHAQTLYAEERKLLRVGEDKAYEKLNPCMDTLCIQDVSNLDAQVRLGKDRVGEVSLGEDNSEPNGSHSTKRFVPPTVEEVRAYCTEHKYRIDAERFIAHYEMVGWVYGKARTPIKSWKAAVTTWAKNEASFSASSAPARREAPIDYD